MADYWVSRAKHYCKYCKCWIQGDKISIQRHEQGPRHRDKLQWFVRNSKRDKEKKEYEDRQLQRQLDQINRAAHAQVGGSVAPSSRLSGAAPLGGTHHSESTTREVQDDEDEDEEIPIGEVLGQYAVDDVLYLQGNWHHDLLLEGQSCQVMLPDQDEWMSGEIAQVDVVPTTGNQTSRRYTFKPQDSDRLYTVQPDDVRVVAPLPPPQEDVPPPPSAETQQGATRPALGTWQTVAVEHVDEQRQSVDALAEAIAQRDQVEDEDENVVKHEGPSNIPAANDPTMDGDDTYSMLNPFGGQYKGMDVRGKNDDYRLHDEDDADVEQGPPSMKQEDTKPVVVKFKKKKRRGQQLQKKPTT